MGKSENEFISYGMVKIIDGYFKGRIGYFDDNTTENGVETGIVYFGNPMFTNTYVYIPLQYLDNITTEDLYRREEELRDRLREENSYKKRATLLSEFLLIETVFSKRYIRSRFLKSENGKKIFISHSSKDKTIVRLIATDLSIYGHQPWLDEWEIKAGQSIPKEISKGIEECDYVIVILSNYSVDSSWVENEWQAKYWDEINEGNIKVIPVLIEDCKIPKLLSVKKYANFKYSYQDGLAELLFAIK